MAMKLSQVEPLLLVGSQPLPSPCTKMSPVTAPAVTLPEASRVTPVAWLVANTTPWVPAPSTEPPMRSPALLPLA